MAGEGLAEPEAEVVASLGDGEEEVASVYVLLSFFLCGFRCIQIS